ncbi:MAG: serine/threonine protein kinase [Myxococcales bacterium]|nr:serine/threonine protein kinase [Myxococcales bacterium]
MAESEKTRVLAVPPQEDSSSGYLAPGSPVGNYVISDLISDGGCGSVYRAKHSLLGRPVAIKVLRREFSETGSSMAKRFLLEALAINMIRHPNIVDVFEFGQLPDGRPFYVMEHLEGQDLDSAIKRHGRYTPAEALVFLEPVCEALEAAHRAGFVHRDIKASNVHVGRSLDGKTTVKLLDFGVAKALNPDNPGAGLTVAGSRIGTTSAMAPEQIRGGDITPATDIYALGVLLFRVLVGRNPFSAADPNEVEQMHLKASPPRPSEFARVSPEIDAVVLRAMQKKPQERFGTAHAFLDALKAAVTAESQVSAPPAARAVGILVDLRTDETADDLAMADVLTCLDIAEPALIAAGYSMVLQTGSALLAVKPLPENDPVMDRLMRAEAIGTAQHLWQELSARPDPETAVQVNVSVHATSATVRKVGDGLEIEGGPIVEISQWAPGDAQTGVFVTADAGRDVDQAA